MSYPISTQVLIVKGNNKAARNVSLGDSVEGTRSLVVPQEQDKESISWEKKTCREQVLVQQLWDSNPVLSLAGCGMARVAHGV